MTIKAIFLDFYGTVVQEDEESLIKICHKIKEHSITESSAIEIGHYWMGKFTHLINSCQGEKFSPQREISANSLKDTLLHFNSTANEDELLEIMFTPWKNPAIFTDAIEFFEKNTLPIYILSNVDQSDISEAINLLHLKVDGVITSEDVRAYKPHSEMFEYALKLSGLSPEEVLHVGDSLTGDVLGANQVGIQSCWLNRSQKSIQEESKPTFVIENLNEIFALLN
ncbi:HAD family hydrolase [Bacillus sp. CGMCC 1.16607]|uniref:HAD family hydrolase n=1 Tax=Bacillus sp. CGMCC 1.16607 TaxID=3351842 RepID=UPI0036308CE7